jgi:hypothetical protein
MKTLTFLLALFFTGIYAVAQNPKSGLSTPQLLSQSEHFSSRTGNSLTGFTSGNIPPEMLFAPEKQVGLSEGLILDSIVVEIFNDDNLWIKEGIYKYGVEEAGDTITFKLYFPGETTNSWTGYPVRIYVYDKHDSIIWEVNYSYHLNVKDKTISYYYMVEYLYSYNEGKTEQKISYKRNYTNGELHPDLKTIQEFDPDRNLLKKETFNWNAVDESWIQSKEYLYAYDTNGYQILNSEISWDTFTGVKFGVARREFEFDEHGRVLVDIAYRWDWDRDVWILDYNSSYSYYDNDKVDIRIDYMWNRIENKLQPTSKIDHDYDSSGNETRYVRWVWNSSLDDWEKKDSYECEYDENGNKTKYIVGLWDNTLNDWVWNYKQENLFNDNSRQILKSIYNWDASKNLWIGTEKTEYEYNVNDKLLNETEYQWNDESNSWMNFKKVVYNFDDYNNYTYALLYDWIIATQDWLLVSERLDYIYEYDGSGKIISVEDRKNWEKDENYYDENGEVYLIKVYSWIDSINDWKLKSMHEWINNAEGNFFLHSSVYCMIENDYCHGSRSEQEFSESGRILMQSSFYWDYISKYWIGNYKYEYTYYRDHHKTVKRFIWNSESKDWRENLKETYYYRNEIAVNAREVELEHPVKVYPNPANREIYLNTGGINSGIIDLFTINGDKVLSEKYEPGIPISVGNMKEGLYLLRLTTDSKTFTAKLIIQH